MENEMVRLARNRARETRHEFNLSPVEPVRDIFRLLMDEGIYLVKYPFGMQSVSGLYVKWRDRALVVVDSSKTLGHQVFTAAHELYHARYDAGRPYSICNPNGSEEFQRDKGEVACDLFAAEFLMPQEGIEGWFLKRKGEIPKTPEIRDIFFLQQHFGVSFQAVLSRLLRIGLISASEYAKCQAELQNKVIRAARRFGLDVKLYVPDNEVVVPNSFVEYAINCYDLGKISLGRLNELLRRVRLSVHDIELNREVTPEDVI